MISTHLLDTDPLELLRQRGSAKWRTYGPEVISLTVAEMDFPLAEPISVALHEAITRSDAGYAMAVPGFGQAFAQFAGARWDWEVRPEWITPVTDVGVGVTEFLRALTRPGDSVVICPPVYPPFFDWVGEAAARVLEVPLAHTPDGWRLDLPALERAFATHPAAFVLCNPHNPVGRVHTREELEALVRLASRYRVTLVSDEIHGPLVLDGTAFTPLLSIPGAARIAVSAVSASKAWNVAGLKCAGIVAATPAMRSVVDRFPPDTQWRVGHLGVIAAIAAYRDGTPWLDQLLATLQDRRSLLTGLLGDRLPELTWQPAPATYLAWLDCSALGDGDAGQEFFLEHAHVALEPGLSFGPIGSGYARLNFGTSAEVLDQATARMREALDRVPGSAALPGGTR